MNRREIIRRLAYTIPGGIMLPSLISSCNNIDQNGNSAFKGTISIIGAGASGLYAAYLLNEQGINVKIYEAAGTHGGRIKYLQGFSDFPLELGTDEILGNDNIWYRLIEQSGISIIEKEILSHYVLDNEIGTAEDFSNDVDFLLSQGFREQIPNYQGPDVSVQAAINKSGIKERVHFILNTEIGNIYGTDNSTLGMRGISEQQKNWKGGSGIHILEGQSQISVINSSFSKILPKISYNTPVVSIDYTGDKVELGTVSGETISTDMVIVTVPLSILRDGDISFSPTLPALKLDAINNLGMDDGLKAALAFNGNFWGAKTTSIISNGMIPRYYAPGIGRSKANSVLAAFVMGAKATALGEFSEQQIYQQMLDELDALYNGNASRLVVRDQDDNFLGVVQNWSNEPYIRGAISYPKIGSSLSGDILALPLEDRVFFAGEATAKNDDAGTVQGALSSSERVFSEVIEAIAKSLEPT